MSIFPPRRVLTYSLFLGLFSGPVFGLNEWPQFRGPQGDGVGASANVPVSLSETEGVRWKTAIHGKAWSSPIISGSRIWLTTATEDGSELSLVVVDKDSGAVLRDEVLFKVQNPQFCHKFNSYASPTPVVADGRVYVTFGSPYTACFEEETGKKLWERTDFVCNHFRGSGSSPIVWRDFLLMHFDGSDFQYVVALDVKTGKTVWRTERSVDFKDLNAEGKITGDGDFRKAFATPVVADWQGQPILLSSGAKCHYAYDPKTGKELWQGRLPAGGFATPMTYEYKGAQYVVIAAGGHGQLGTEPGDSFVAFRLAGPGESPSLWSRTIDRPGGRMWVWLSLIAMAVLFTARGILWLFRRKITTA